jgi:hypothetical protein
MNYLSFNGQAAGAEAPFETLQKEFKQAVQVKPDIEKYTIIFGYEGLQMDGILPGVVILGGSVFICGFSSSSTLVKAQADSVGAVASGLVQCHADPGSYDVYSVLVLAGAKDFIRRCGDVVVISPGHISDLFTIQYELETGSLIDPVRWIAGR